MHKHTKSTLKISILIPTFDRPHYLPDAVESCLQQNYEDIEILIGDDSPGQQTQDVVQTCFKAVLGKKVFYFKNPRSLGQAENVHSLMMSATGDTIMVLHDDDYLLPEALNDLRGILEKSPEVIAVFGMYLYINSKKEILEYETERRNKLFYKTEEFQGTKLSPQLSALLQQFTGEGFLVRAEYAKKTGYDYAGAAGDACDFYFGWKLSQFNKPFYFLHRYISAVRIGIDSCSTGRGSRAGLGNSGFYWIKIIHDEVPSELLHEPRFLQAVKQKIAGAVSGAARIGHLGQAWKFLFSKKLLKAWRPLAFMKTFFVLIYISSCKFVQNLMPFKVNKKT